MPSIKLTQLRFRVARAEIAMNNAVEAGSADLVRETHDTALDIYTELLSSQNDEQSHLREKVENILRAGAKL